MMDRCIECDVPIFPAPLFHTVAGEPIHMLCLKSRDGETPIMVDGIVAGYNQPMPFDEPTRPNALQIEQELVRMEREYKFRNDNDPED